MAAYLLKAFATGAGVPVPLPLGSTFGGVEQGTAFGTGIGLLLNFPTGVTATATVEVSGIASNALGIPWNSHDVLVSLSANKNSSIQFPVGAVRLNVSSISGSPPEGGAAYVALWIIAPGNTPINPV